MCVCDNVCVQSMFVCVCSMCICVYVCALFAYVCIYQGYSNLCFYPYVIKMVSIVFFCFVFGFGFVCVCGFVSFWVLFCFFESGFL